MPCTEQERVSEYLAGRDPAFADHLRDCAACRDALESAMILKSFLQQQEKPPGTAHLTDLETAGWLDGSLEEPQRRRARAHLAECSACRRELLDLTGDMEALRSIPLADRPLSLWARMRAGLSRPLIIPAIVTTMTVLIVLALVLIKQATPTPDQIIQQALNAFVPGPSAQLSPETWAKITALPPLAINQLPPPSAAEDPKRKAEITVAAGYYLQHMIDLSADSKAAPATSERLAGELETLQHLIVVAGIKDEQKIATLTKKVKAGTLRESELAAVAEDILKSAPDKQSQLEVGRWLYMVRSSAVASAESPAQHKYFQLRVDEINDLVRLTKSPSADPEEKIADQTLATVLENVKLQKDTPLLMGQKIDELIATLAGAGKDKPTWLGVAPENK